MCTLDLMCHTISITFLAGTHPGIMPDFGTWATVGCPHRCSSMWHLVEGLAGSELKGARLTKVVNGEELIERSRFESRNDVTDR